MSAKSPQTKAFTQSSGGTFNGQPIAPFTPQRQAIASDMGMSWPWLRPSDIVTMPVTIGGKKITVTHYKQSYRDSIIALWLCSQTEARIDEAESNPDAAKKEAWEWAKRIGLNQNSPLSGEALFEWMQITKAVTESKAEPVAKHKRKADDEPGEL